MSNFGYDIAISIAEVPTKLKDLEREHGTIVSFQIVKLYEDSFYIFTQHKEGSSSK